MMKIIYVRPEIETVAMESLQALLTVSLVARGAANEAFDEGVSFTDWK